MLPASGSSSCGCSRRQFLRSLSAAGAALVVPGAPAVAADAPRVLSLVNTHTGGSLAVAYWERGAYLAEGLAALNTFLRDHRTGDEYPMDPPLFDILHDLRLAAGTREPFQVISGYRSPRSNALLRAEGHGVASGSLHMQGRAIDIRVADVASDRLRNAAVTLRRGGVGYYRASDFVHVDTGHVRCW
jgi:uncharacterized protein YcbK (DUF882 family)